MPGDNIPESMGEDFSESVGEDISEQAGAIVSESVGGFPRNQQQLVAPSNKWSKDLLPSSMFSATDWLVSVEIIPTFRSKT
jgi:hypothetical protein